jgi:DNA-binding GntR family transcriptional regulator
MTMPDPRAYRRLAALLRDQITSGMIAPGAQLPPIGELRREHGHSRQTVAKAMSILQGEGLICRWPGLGYFTAAKDEGHPRGARGGASAGARGAGG